MTRSLFIALLALGTLASTAAATSLEEAKAESALPFNESLGGVSARAGAVFAASRSAAAAPGLAAGFNKLRKTSAPPAPKAAGESRKGVGTQVLEGAGYAAGFLASAALATTGIGFAVIMLSGLMGANGAFLQARVLEEKSFKQSAAAAVEGGMRGMLGLAFFGAALGRGIAWAGRAAGRGAAKAGHWVAGEAKNWP